MVIGIEELRTRVDKIEELKNQEILTLVEILSNATFFGEIKKANCEYSKNGQCSYFVLKAEERNKIPIIAKCQIKNCEELNPHCHLEISNITCSLCPKQITTSATPFKKNRTPKTKYPKY